MRPIEDIVMDISKRLDPNFLVVQKDRDTGDSAYRSAIFSFLLAVMHDDTSKGYYKEMMAQLQVTPGIFRRTSARGTWGSNPNNMSRDQAEALLLAAAVQGDERTWNNFYMNAYNRREVVDVPKYGKWLYKINKFVGFHQNVHPGTDAPDDFRKIPDLLGWGLSRNEIRMKKQWWKYPWLMIKDLGFLVDLHFRKKQLWDYDSLLAKDIIYANISMPTPVSMLATYLYSKTDYIERIKHNYADANNGVEPLGELYELVCRKYINHEN